MEIKKYLHAMKDIQSNILNFLEEETNFEENYANLTGILEEQKIREDKNRLQSLLHLLLKISNNHYRSPDFFSKIEKILQFFFTEIMENFSNYEIFNIFKSNKRILLFLIKESVLTIDEIIASKMTNSKYKNYFYPQYFYPEIKSFLKPEMLEEIQKVISDDFEEKRKNGENDNYICELIRSDLINEFKDYIEEANIKLKSQIHQSIFETNSLLLKNNRQPSLIEYAAFFGSIQIFEYLVSSEIKLTNSLWLYAIHGKNLEIIKNLSENDKVNEKSIEKCFDESIKCHHVGISNYFLETYFDEKEDSWKSAFNVLKSYNFKFIKKEYVSKDSFYYLCKYDYLILVDLLLQNKKVENEINEIFINF